MKMRTLLLSIITCLSIVNLTAQSDTTAFKPSGKIIATSFFDYSTGLNGNTNSSGFDITRALLGYQYNFYKGFDATISIDGAGGRSSNDKVEVYVRNAFVSWTEHGFNIELGLMGMKQFNLQEKFWRHRYTLKSLQDLAGMGNSVDVGLSTTYHFSPILSADFTIANGEGNKKIRKDHSMQYSIGATLKPIEHFTLRAYADIYTSDEDYFDREVVGEPIRNQLTYSLFAGYNDRRMTIGTEFNKQLHHKYIRGNHITGISAYSTVNLNSMWNIYARYDYYDSSNSIAEQSGWYDDRQVIITGIEFIPFNFLRFSPNFRNYNYASKSSEQYLFVSGEFKF